MRIFTSLSVGLTVILMSCAVSSSVRQPNPPAYSRVPSGNTFQKEFLKRVNALRAAGCKCGGTYMPPAPALTWNEQLESAALSHARDMYRYKYFDHKSRNGKTIRERIEAAGYRLNDLQSYSYGENIAAGQRSIEQVMTGWIKSPGHCKNLMNPNFREIGVAQDNYYWVQNFGMRKSFGGDVSASN